MQCWVHDTAKIVAHCEISGSVVSIQKWLRAEHGINATVNAQTIANCCQTLMTIGFITDKTRSDDHHPHRLLRTLLLWMKSSQEAHRNQCLQVLLEAGSIIMQLRPFWGKKLSFKPWKLHYVQQLFPDDCGRWKELAESFLGWNYNCPQLFHNILWSDEAVFQVGRFVNRHQLSLLGMWKSR